MLNRKLMLFLAVVLMLILAGNFGSPVFAQGQNAENGAANGDCERDRDYIDDPNHQYCDSETVIECDPSQQRLRDCKCDCPDECLQARARFQYQYTAAGDGLEDVGKRARNFMNAFHGNLRELRERVRNCCRNCDCTEECLREREQIMNEVRTQLRTELSFLYRLRLRLSQSVAE